MTDEQAELLLEARDSVAAAKLLLGGEYPGYAASRAYFAMFYVAESFLEGEGLSFSKHSAVIAAFGREFARTGRVPAEFHRYLMEAQELRHSGDYGARSAVNHEQATEQIKRAEQFLSLAERLIGPIPA
ncbi:MAG: HEPN domain-containing [Geobacteraceae bacterium]|nr:MAG: HEPN domain-containing [Geobacteraceae bacterium]